MLFWSISPFFPRQSILSVKDYLYLALCSVFGVTINQLLFLKGLSMTNPINPAIIMTTTPILVLLVSHLIIREKITNIKLAGITCGLAGALFLLLYGKAFSFYSGDFLVFLNALSYGIYLVLMKSIIKKYNAFTVMKWVFTFGILFVTPFGFGDLVDTNWAIIPTYVWLSAAYLVVMVTFLAYLLISLSMGSLSPSVVGIYIYLQPVLASVIAIAAGKDSITSVKVFSSLLIFAGVFLVSHSKTVKQKISLKSHST